MKDFFAIAIDSLQHCFDGGYLYILLPICFIYLFFKEKNTSHRTIFLWGSLFIIFLYFFPLSGKILYRCLTHMTYWRAFWMVPLIALTCYTATSVIIKFKGIKRLLLFTLISVFVMMSGSYMLKEPNFHEVTNPYKLTQESINTAKWIPDGAYIVGAEWLVPFIRQYNPTITLVNTRWQYSQAGNVLNGPDPDLAILGPLLQDTGCDFVALGHDKNMTITGKWEDYGFHFYRGDNRCIIYINENSSFYSGEP